VHNASTETIQESYQLLTQKNKMFKNVDKLLNKNTGPLEKEPAAPPNNLVYMTLDEFN
jgi:hypothetical protein